MTLKNILAAAAILVGTALNAQDTLVVMYTNDTHSAIMPLSQNLNDTLTAGRGGYLRRMAAISRERQSAPGLLLFDSGDFSQGSPFYTLFRGDVEVGLMNLMAYDAATLGNHEFDFGLDNLARLIRKAAFPVVTANYDVAGTVLEGLVKPFTVIQRDSVRIGVFGLSPRLEGLVARDNYRGVAYTDPIEAARRVVKQLREKEHCDVVVCLSHLGCEPTAGEVDDSTLVATTGGIDIVLGGHSHMYFDRLKFVRNADGRDVPIDQNGRHGIYVGKLILAVDRKP